MSHDILNLASFAVGVTMMLGSAWLNQRLAGQWRGAVRNYTPSAKFMFYGGAIVILAGTTAAKIFY
jgi:hypothetical protein